MSLLSPEFGLIGGSLELPVRFNDVFGGGGVFLEVPDTVTDPGFHMIFVSCTEYCQYSRDLSHTASLVSFPPVCIASRPGYCQW